MTVGSGLHATVGSDSNRFFSFPVFLSIMSAAEEVCLSDRKMGSSEVETDGVCKDQCLRKSTRDPSIALMDRNDLSILLNRIRDDHFSTIVLKIKDQLLADINSTVFESIVEALWRNKVCQGLYIQNLSKAIGDDQLHKLVDLLKKKKIWCLNIGETYEVSTTGWHYFCDKLPETNITHLYVSEHTIPIDLKNRMRDHIRENRKKHKLHCAFKNISVIERCTHMWWNPVNGVKELKPPPPPKEEPEEVEEVVAAPELPPLTAAHTAYWQEGVGAGGDKPWKFKCMCGETCSSYENFRYHPTGRMYECSNAACCLWSHVSCVLGPNISDAELDKMKDLLCGACKAKSRRLVKYTGVTITELNAPPEPPTPPKAASTKSKSKGKKEPAPVNESIWSRPAGHEQDEDDSKPWSFKCKCGEVCSSYENPLYHPKGQWFECSQCSVWSHVLCLLGNLTPEQVLEMKETLCFSCTSKNRRSRSGRGLAAPDAHLGVALPEAKPTAPAPIPVLAVVDSTALTSIVPAVATGADEPVEMHVVESDVTSVAFSTTTSESAGTEVSASESVVICSTAAKAGEDVGQSELVKRKGDFSHEPTSTRTSENNTQNV